ncbi:hypothetical protein V6N12_068672 [Hibiscus sabdariffa]|uniref:DUF659 domain-containing protein n=1 Tax=Hibiscus sabdariffa TaxID=183260 RepID=A0ABR2FQV6_9ROSI
MPPRMDKFPSEGLEGALSKDIGWHSGNPVPNARGHVICKLCGKVTKGGITRFKEHIAHKGGEVLACPNVTGMGEEDDEFFDDVSAMRQATRESIQSQHEWHRREEFRRSTGGWGNVYEEGRSSSHGSVRGHRGERSIPNESEFNLRIAIPELVKSKSLRQPKVDVSRVRSRDADFYYNLLDKVIEEIGEEYIIQIVTDNEAAMKAAGKRLMLKRTHLYWTSCAAHGLDLCLEDIGKKSSVARVLEEAKKVTCFIYNHIWTVDLMKKYTNGKQILRPALTVEEITRQKQGLRDMFNSKLLTFRGKHETFGTPQAQRAWSLMNPDVDPLSEWIQEKENPLLDGENAGLFPVDSSDDEINVVDQSEEQNLSDSSSSATPTQSGGDGQDSGIGDLSPIYDDDRESGDRGEIRSSHRHGEEYGIGSAGGRFRLMSEFGGNMSATPSDSRERSESRARSKEKGKGTKKHTSEGSSRRRSTSSNPGYTDSSTSTRDFYPPGSGQSSYS